jgi:hypothetical protein
MSNLDNLREQRPGNRENIDFIKKFLLNDHSAHLIHERSEQGDSPDSKQKNQA